MVFSTAIEVCVFLSKITHDIQTHTFKVGSINLYASQKIFLSGKTIVPIHGQSVQ